MFNIGDKVKIKIDNVLDKYKEYTDIYEIEEIRVDNNDVKIYKLTGVPDWGTEDMLEKVGDE